MTQTMFSRYDALTGLHWCYAGNCLLDDIKDGGVNRAMGLLAFQIENARIFFYNKDSYDKEGCLLEFIEVRFCGNRVFFESSGSDNPRAVLWNAFLQSLTT